MRNPRPAAMAVLLAAALLAGCSNLQLHFPSFRGAETPAEADAAPPPEAIASTIPSTPPPEGSAPGGVEVITGGPEVEFHTRASQFYQRMEGRRFNSIASYRDPGLREYFENEQAFSEYFANMARDLVDAHFEHNEPIVADVQEFTVEGPGRAHVRVRIVGENGLPMRWWSTHLDRNDRWERRDGRWIIVPGREG